MSRSAPLVRLAAFALLVWAAVGGVSCADRSLPPSPAAANTTGGPVTGSSGANTGTTGTTGTSGTSATSNVTGGPVTGSTGATGTTGTGSSCAHDYCVGGGKLDPSCDPCVAQICAVDSYCCTNHWSQPCVAEVGSICNLQCAGSTTAGSGTTSGFPTGPSTTTGTTAGGGSATTPLHFAVFGDSRPPNQNATTDYPSAVVAGIFSLAQSRNAQFVVGTGDYMYASTSASVDGQIALFLAAESNYKGPVYLTMGNHECNGYTNSNCPALTESPNVQGYMAKLVPSGVSQPFYRVDVATPNGAAKFLFVAANAWSTAQASWLSAQLAMPTTYTFLVRHEPSYDNTAPGVTPSDALIAGAAYTLQLLGHTHEYRHIDSQHVISGNAGAPFTGGFNSYGMLFIDQLPNGNLTVTEVDESTGMATDSWTITPSGQPVN